jgi:hypothetical protein
MTPRAQVNALLDLRTPRERAAAVLGVAIDQVVIARFHAGTRNRTYGETGPHIQQEIRMHVRGEDPFGDPMRVGTGGTVQFAARDLELKALERERAAAAGLGHCNVYALGCLEVGAGTCSCDCAPCAAELTGAR